MFPRPMTLRILALLTLAAGLHGQSAPVPSPATSSTLEQLSKYRYGDATGALFHVEEELRKGNSEARARMESLLLALLRDAATTEAAKESICRLLGWMGGEEAVPVLSALAASCDNASGNASPSVGGYAVRALATIPAKSANRALLELLSSGSEERQLAVISAVGTRGTTAAIPQLATIAAMQSPVLAGAALQTLASFGTADALDAILRVKAGEGNASLKEAAVISASSLLAAKGSAVPDAAVEQLTAIVGSEAPVARRLSALRVLLRAHRPDAYQQAVGLLKNGDGLLREGAAEALARFATHEQLGVIPWQETPDAWIVALDVLAQQADPSSLPMFERALASKDGDVRLVAIAGLARCGDGRNLGTLTPLLGDTNSSVAQAARKAVATLKGKDVNDRLLALQKSASPALSAILLSLLADRQEHGAFNRAITAMGSPDPDLQKAGCEALSRLAASGDLAKCLALLPGIKTTEAANYQKAVVRAALLDPNPAAAAAQISEAFDRGNDVQKEILINVLARLEVKEANDKLALILDSRDVDMRKQAIRALSSARSTASLTLLLAVAARGRSNPEKILALRGYIDTIAAQTELSDTKRFEAYRNAWKLAVRNEEKEAVRAAVGKIPQKKIPKTKEAGEFLKEVHVPATAPAAAPSPGAKT
jgi:HEAT repeat protein